MKEEFLEIRGGRVHNLKDIDLRLPHDRLVVVTGVSGSGKSSLAFDIIYAEGRRRYVESLSSYARQFLERMDPPDVEEVLGLAPTIAIRQSNATRNPRSTVATVTEIHDFLRLLFARVGHMHCSDCGELVMSDGVDHVTSSVLSLEEGSRWQVLFPVREQDITESQHKLDERYSGYPSRLTARLAQLRDRGYSRLFQDGRTFEFSTPESLLDLDLDRSFDVLVDRIAISPDIRERVSEAVELCYRECKEVYFKQAGEAGDFLRFSSSFECSRCARQYRRPEPDMFSPHSARGMCGRCSGTGRVLEYSMDRIVRWPHLSLLRGAVEAFEYERKFRKYKTSMLRMARQVGISVNESYQNLPLEHKELIEHGGHGFPGVLGFLGDLEAQRPNRKIDRMLQGWRAPSECPSCQGAGISQAALRTRVGGKTIEQVLALPLLDALEFFSELCLQGGEAEIASNLLSEIRNRLRFLNDVGLEYLTLDRAAPTLSGGESQRIQLASSLGSRLVGVCYVLDEPSIGLHSRDTHRLISVLKELRDLGNTVFVVEHDRDMMRAADHIVDLGPGAGELGGEVVFSGSLSQMQANGTSLTGRYLSGEARIPLPKERRTPVADRVMTFADASKHNLRNIEFEIPLGLLTVVTGVSGSGKSTLMHEVVYRCLEDVIQNWSFLESRRSVGGVRVSGHNQLMRVVRIDQSLTDRTSRSVPATYLGVFDEIRLLFANTSRASDRYLHAGMFSFNTPGGRCEQCSGTGKVTINLQFLADVDLPCEECNGKRYKAEVLEVTYRGKNIWEVLQQTIDEALRFFSDSKWITKKLSVASEIGLGYIRLGQPVPHLSGGEAQRLKLAQYMVQANASRALFLFDEPTTGLHFDDIKKLLGAFERLLDDGASVLVVEHNLDVIKCADWVIDLGPGGGNAGGRVVAAGPPEEIANCAASETGRFLREVLQ